MTSTPRDRTGSDADAVRAAQILVAMARGDIAGDTAGGAEEQAQVLLMLQSCAAGCGGERKQAQTLQFCAAGCGSPGCEGEVVGCALYCAACIARARARTASEER